jgi:hypothetical protein
MFGAASKAKTAVLAGHMSAAGKNYCGVAVLYSFVLVESFRFGSVSAAFYIGGQFFLTGRGFAEGGGYFSGIADGAGGGRRVPFRDGPRKLLAA